MQVGRRATLAGMLGLVGCLSPTVPLPPPALPSVGPGSEPGTVRLSSVGGVAPEALVLVINRNPDVPRERRVAGTVADERGSWSLDTFASVGDALDVTQEIDGVRSPPLTVRVR